MQLIRLASHAEQYIQQQGRQRQTHDRPDGFGDVEQSRRDAFQ